MEPSFSVTFVDRHEPGDGFISAPAALDPLAEDATDHPVGEAQAERNDPGMTGAAPRDMQGKTSRGSALFSVL
jgi:hypothetical protein